MIQTPRNARANPYCGYYFSQGSLSSWTLVDSQPTIRIVPKKHFNNQWLWFAVRSRKWAGKTPHFLIAKADRRVAPDATNEIQAFWSTSLDTDTWTAFATQTVGASDIEFYHDSAFPGGTIYVAFLPAYPFSRIQRKMTAWAADARVVDTPSTTNFIIDNMTARANGDGRTAPALPIYGFKVTNNSGFTKNIMILAAGNHPDESSGMYQLEAAVDWLLAGSVQAEFLLDWFEVYVYPCMNPQGVWGGYFRSCPEDASKDHNRVWDTGGLEDVDHLKTAMNADTGGTIQVGIDFHSGSAAVQNIPAYMDTDDHTAGLYAVYYAKMGAYITGFGYIDETITTGLTYLWKNTYSCPLSLSNESMNQTGRTVTAIKNEGGYALKTVAAMQAQKYFTNGPDVGSRGFNGSTDRIDWANVANLSGAAFTISAWIYLDVVTQNQYILCPHDSGDASYGIVFNSPQDGYIGLGRLGGTDYLWRTQDTVMSTLTGAWHHVLVTSDGGLLEGSVKIYLNGVSKTLTFVNGTGAETAHTGSWSLGGRIYSDTRNLDGKIAHVRVFSRVLSAGEIAQEAAGDVSTSTGLIFWFKGNTSSLTASPGGDGVADGTTQLSGAGNGPPVYNP